MGHDLFCYSDIWWKCSNWSIPNGKVTGKILDPALSNRTNPALANLEDKYVFVLGDTSSSRGNWGTSDYYNIANNTWTKGP